MQLFSCSRSALGLLGLPRTVHGVLGLIVEYIENRDDERNDTAMTFASQLRGLNGCQRVGPICGRAAALGRTFSISLHMQLVISRGTTGRMTVEVIVLQCLYLSVLPLMPLYTTEETANRDWSNDVISNHRGIFSPSKILLVLAVAYQ